MTIEISVGEAIDRLTILKLKSRKITDKQKLANVNNELSYLEKLISFQIKGIYENIFYIRLYEINERLWGIEDELRVLESKKDFGERFLELARAVYYTNDERADLKKEINLAYKSNFIEEKSYEKYKNS